MAASNAGWPSQFRFAVHAGWSRVPEPWTLGGEGTSRTNNKHENMNKKIITLILVAVIAASTAYAQGEIGTAQLSWAQNGGSFYAYSITLNNTGSVPIGTFWYAWTPGELFLPSYPLSERVPTGWVAFVEGNYSIEYVADSGYALGAGSSLDFGFNSTDTPTALAGDFSSYPGTPIGTSYIYSGKPDVFGGSDPGYEFVVESVPEPSVLGLLTVGFLGLASACRRKW